MTEVFVFALGGLLLRLTVGFMRGPGRELIQFVILSAFIASVLAVLVSLGIPLEAVTVILILGITIIEVVLVRTISFLHVIVVLIGAVVRFFLTAQSPGFLWSRWFIIRLPRCRTPGPVCEASCATPRNSLCGTCGSLVRSSALITGTSSIFTSPVETHGHHTHEGLLRSATDCHLCSLLKDSVGASAIVSVDPRPDNYGSISQSGEDSGLSVVVSQTQQPGCRAVLQIRSDPEKFQDSVGLPIQRIYGRSCLPNAV
jgi:hypothetical protein